MKQRINFSKNPDVIAGNITSRTSPAGAAAIDFSKRIAAKYTSFRKPAGLPNLIFLRSFGTRVLKKIININQLRSIKNNFGLHLDFCFKTFSRLNRQRSYHYQSQKSQYSADSGKTTLLAESKIPGLLKNLLHFSKNSAAYFSLRKIDNFIQNIQYLRNISPIGKTRHLLTSHLMSYGHNNSQSYNLVEHTEHIRILKPYSLRLQSIADPRGQTFGLTNLIQLKADRWNSQSDLISRTVKSRSASASYKADGSKNMAPLNRKSFMAAAFGPSIRQRNVNKTARGDLYFHDQGWTEREIKELRKMVEETKEAVKETNHHSHEEFDAVIKQHLDINRISDQVYRNIERRIRTERERRGL